MGAFVIGGFLVLTTFILIVGQFFGNIRIPLVVWVPIFLVGGAIGVYISEWLRKQI